MIFLIIVGIENKRSKKTTANNEREIGLVGKIFESNLKTIEDGRKTQI
ncbi:MAG: hypothetical protein PHX62_00625 [Bacilli bacterium]|nr:hypothetical protein [Bacilli bacterium]